MRASLLGLGLALAASVACVRGPRAAPRRDHGPVVARVAGDAIHADEVAAVARLERVTAREALDRIVRDRVLAREALRRGAAIAVDTEDAAWRGRLQLLLAREVEGPHTAETIPNDFFAALYQRRRVALHHDGLVRVIHALAVVDRGSPTPTPPEVARAAAARFRRRVVEAGAAITRERFEALVREVPGMRFEEIPPFDRGGQSEDGTSFAEPFVRASWALTESSALSEVVETTFGYHVILRVGAVPPKVATPEQVRAAVLREGVNVRRAHALTTLLERLRAASDVRLSETAIASTGAAARP